MTIFSKLANALQAIEKHSNENIYRPCTLVSSPGGLLAACLAHAFPVSVCMADPLTFSDCRTYDRCNFQGDHCNPLTPVPDR
jgi:hypothetical protein